MADEYKINVRDVDDTSSAASGAYYVPIDDIGSGGGGGGSGLPAVTSDDNGDVLTVVEGQWAKAAPSGGVLVVTDIEGTLDHTWQEIHDAALAVLKYNDGNESCILNGAEVDDGYYLSFASFIGDGAGGTTVELYTYVAESADSYPTAYDPEG